VFPSWLEGQDIHKEAVKHALTLMVTGRSAGVDEEEWCGLLGVDEDDGSLQGKQGKKVCVATRSGSSLPDGSGSAKTVRSHGRAPPHLLLILLLLLDVAGGGLGKGEP
jgi:hypothetical protein